MRLLYILLTLVVVSCSKTLNNENVLEEEVVAYPVYGKQDKLEILTVNHPADSILQTLNSFQQKHWKEKGVSGGMLVAKNGEIIFEKYMGEENRVAHKKITKDSQLHVASISKVLTSLAILKLVESKALKLDEPVSTVLPSFVDKEITIRNLLSHRSGLQNYAYFQADKLHWKKDKMKTNQDVLNYINFGLDKRNGSANKKFSYSNTNYAILALVIEKLTGVPYAEAMRQMIFKPLKMKDTFVFNIQDSAKVSQSYGSKGAHWQWTDLDQIVGDKNIYSTPRDLLRLDLAMYHENFLSPKLFAEMKKGYSYENPGVKNYGLGMRLMEFPNHETLYYHNGWWHGNYSVYVRDEKNKITLIALGNNQVRSVYDVFSLAGYFGDYPVGFETLNLN